VLVSEYKILLKYSIYHSHIRFLLAFIIQDTHEWVHRCDRCQRTRSISRRREMPLQNIQEIEVFYSWGIDFIRSLPSSF